MVLACREHLSPPIEITITGTNDAPVAAADIATVGENDLLLVNVLVNDTDVDGAVLTVTSATAPSGQGSASVVGNQVQFDPGTDFDYLAVGESTAVVVDYEIVDEHGAASNSTLTITVTGTNDAPVATADIAGGGENETLLVDVLANDTDVDNGSALTVTSATAPSGQGSASVVGNQVQFDPGSDFDYLAVGETATVTVDYAIQDEHGATSSSTIGITVTGTNDAPVASNGSGSTAEDAPLVGTLPAATDAEGHSIAYALENDAINGSVNVNADGSFSYTPDADFNGTDSFTFTVSDGNGGSNSYSYEITVDPVNDTPAGTNDSYATDEDTALIVAGPGVLANDGDVDGDTLESILVAGPSHGTLALSTDGSFTYTPDADYNGTDSFTYTPNDGTTDGNTVTVNLTVNAVNDAPTITSDGGADTAAVAVEENQTEVTTVASSDVDGASPVYSIAGGADSGMFAINPATGALSFVAAPDFEAPGDADGDNDYEVVVQVSDGSASDSQAITVTVSDADEGAPPVAGEDKWTLSDATIVVAGIITAAWFTQDDSDPDADPLYVTEVSGLPVGMTANYDGSGHLVDITGTTPAVGTYNLTYTLSDGSNEVTSTVAMTIVDTTSSGTDNIALDGNDFSYVDLISGNDVISGDAFLSGNAGTDWFVGNNGNDSISGGAGDDKLFGNDNLDTINGGTGNDVLSGGNGGDFFVFNTPLNAATNVDAILDFGAAENGGNQDVIQLESDIFQFGAALDASEFASNAGGTATSANAQIVHDINTGNLYYDADGTGGVEAILFATVTLSGGSLDYSDFAII